MAWRPMGNDVEDIRPRTRCVYDCQPTATPAPPVPEVEPSAAAVDIEREVARFVPKDGRISSDPDGVAVVGERTRLTARVDAVTRDAEILGRDVRVRFEPLRFVWTIGGERRETEAAATDYSFTERGSETVQVTPGYRASLDAGDGWRELPGVVDGPALQTTLRVVEVRSVNVGESCDDDPDGPGC